MEEALAKIMRELREEIERGKEIWGDEFDKKNTANDWVTYVNIYMGRAVSMNRTPGSKPEGDHIFDEERYRVNMKKAAGLIINSLLMLETEGFPKRHYDD